MDSREDGADVVDLDRDLSLQEVIQIYDVSLRALRKRVRVGQIPAYKTRGPWGHEWRVNGRVLQAAGLRRRAVELHIDGVDPRIAALKVELATLGRVVLAERARADEADRELGYAMLECGRLRSALAKALRPPDNRQGRTPVQPGWPSRRHAHAKETTDSAPVA